MKSVTSKITYNEAASDCKSNGKQLCNSKEICKDGKTPVSGVVAGDHWVPVKDSSNEWLQLGMILSYYRKETAAGSFTCNFLFTFT